MKREKNKRAQSVLEYIIVLTAIVGIILVAANSLIGPAARRTVSDSADAIKNAADQIAQVK